jgi:lipopolysaccharide transport system permease protein
MPSFWNTTSVRDSTTVISHRPESIWRYASPWRLVLHFVECKELIWQFTLREVQGRYRGSNLGILWALINPLLMLMVYTFVFSVIFKARWGVSGSESFMDFALILFSGIIAFNVFSECVTRAPVLIISNPNYVKKVVFPLEILPVSVLGSAVIHSLMSLGIVLAGLLLSTGKLHWTLLYLPLVYLPLAALTLGLSWLLASLGVFIRDIGNFIGVAITLLLFLTPILYPMSAVPESIRPIFQLNPLSVIVEDFRRVVMWGQPPDWIWLGGVTLVSGLVMLGGYMWFMKIKRAFADVI